MVTRIISFLAAASLLMTSTIFAAPPSHDKRLAVTSTLDDQQSVSLTLPLLGIGQWRFRKSSRARLFYFRPGATVELEDTKERDAGVVIAVEVL